MATKPISTRLDPTTISRLERVAAVDRRSVAQVMALLIERSLPAWEDELEARQRGYLSSGPAPDRHPAADIALNDRVAPHLDTPRKRKSGS